MGERGGVGREWEEEGRREAEKRERLMGENGKKRGRREADERGCGVGKKKQRAFVCWLDFPFLDGSYANQTVPDTIKKSAKKRPKQHKLGLHRFRVVCFDQTTKPLSSPLSPLCSPLSPLKQHSSTMSDKAGSSSAAQQGEGAEQQQQQQGGIDIMRVPLPQLESLRRSLTQVGRHKGENQKQKKKSNSGSACWRMKGRTKAS